MEKSVTLFKIDVNLKVKPPARNHRRLYHDSVGTQTEREFLTKTYDRQLQQSVNRCISSFFSANPQFLPDRKEFHGDTAVNNELQDEISAWMSGKINLSPVDSGVSSSSHLTNITGRALQFPMKFHPPARKLPLRKITCPCAFLDDLKAKICEKFAEYGECECPNCRQNFNGLNMAEVQKELQTLNGMEIRQIFRYCGNFRFLFNRMFPILAEPMGSRRLVDELTSVIAACSPEQYQNVVFGFIHADFMLKDAVMRLLEHRRDNSMEANRKILTIITNYGLTLYFYDFLDQCTRDAGYFFDLCTVKAIISDVISGNRSDWTLLIQKIVYKHLTVQDQHILSADPIWLDFISF